MVGVVELPLEASCAKPELLRFVSPDRERRLLVLLSLRLLIGLEAVPSVDLAESGSERRPQSPTPR